MLVCCIRPRPILTVLCAIRILTRKYEGVDRTRLLDDTKADLVALDPDWMIAMLVLAAQLYVHSRCVSERNPASLLAGQLSGSGFQSSVSVVSTRSEIVSSSSLPDSSL